MSSPPSPATPHPEPVKTGGVALPRLRAVERPSRIPLSTFQLQYFRTNRPFRFASVYRLTTVLDLQMLRRAIGRLSQRHEILRTRYCRDGEACWQEVVEQVDLLFDHLDLRGRSDAERNKFSQDLAGKHLAYHGDGFGERNNLSVRSLILSDDQHILSLDLNHACGDASTATVLIRDLLELYRSESDGTADTLPALPAQYADFALWQREVLASTGDLGQARSEYVRQFEGLRLWDGDPPPPSPSRGKDCIIETTSLTTLARSCEVSAAIIVLTLIGALLSRWTGRQRFSMTNTVDMRPIGALNMAGCFVRGGTLTLDFDTERSFGQLAQMTRAAATEAMDRRYDETPAPRDAQASAIRINILSPPRIDLSDAEARYGLEPASSRLVAGRLPHEDLMIAGKVLANSWRLSLVERVRADAGPERPAIADWFVDALPRLLDRAQAHPASPLGVLAADLPAP